MSESNTSELMSSILQFSPLATSNHTQGKIIKEYQLERYTVPMVSKDVHVGIEVEVENCLLNSSPQAPDIVQFKTFWDSVEDNSLRDNGLEFVSTPVSGERIPVALKVLHNYLHMYFPTHKFTPRTSVHVHVNCRHMSHESFFNFLLLYLVTEPIFYRYADRDGNLRSENNFCVPLEDTKFMLGLPSIIAMYNRGDVKGAVKLLLSSWKKYTGFNLLPMKTQGTAEFRHLGGTCNPDFLIFWINMILSLRKYAEETSIKETKAAIFALNTVSSYTSFIHKVLGISDIPYDELQSALEKSSTTVKSVFSHVDLNKKILQVDDSFPDSRIYKQLAAHKAIFDFDKANADKLEIQRQVTLISKKIANTNEPNVIEKYYKRINTLNAKMQEIDYSFSNVYFSYAVHIDLVEKSNVIFVAV
jgi:hypothetical protein